MAYEVKWTEPVQDEIHEILSYLLEEWGEKAAVLDLVDSRRRNH